MKSRTITYGMHNRCSKIDGFMVLNVCSQLKTSNTVNSQVGTSQNGCSSRGARGRSGRRPGCCEFSEFPTNSTQLNRMLVVARTGQVCLNKGVQVVLRAVPNDGPKLLAERVCIHMMHEQERLTFSLFVVRLPHEMHVIQRLWSMLPHCQLVR